MIPFKTGQKVLEIGGGDNPIYRPNLDIRTGPTVDIVADLNEKFPIEDEIYDGIYSAYLLEHISWRKVNGFIKEIFRVLRPGGTIFLITSNLQQQCKTLIEKQDWEQSDICMLFGDQNYKEWRANAHYCGFSPKSAIEEFSAIGFVDVLVLPHPNCGTDMIITAKKPIGAQMNLNPNLWTSADRKLAYNREYFDGGRGKFGGYAYEGYWDYPVHWKIVNAILRHTPASVLELGPARGYILKKLHDKGIRVKGLEISDHCIQTRVVDEILSWDITNTPWPIADQEFDLCFSIAVLEHIPDNKLDNVINEIKRTCKRGMHGISFIDDNFDRTHTTLKPITWWLSKFPVEQTIIDKEDLVSGPACLPLADDKLKLNIGSFTTMFHYGWINIDIHQLDTFAVRYNYKFKQADVRNGLEFANNTVDMIYMCHFLEHLNYDEGKKILADCARVLKKGGIIRIILPDASLLIDKYKNQQMSQFDELNDGCANNSLQIGKLWSLLFAGHNSLYDNQSIRKILSDIGLNPSLMGFRTSNSEQMLTETLDMFPTLSMYIEGIKTSCF